MYRKGARKLFTQSLSYIQLTGHLAGTEFELVLHFSYTPSLVLVQYFPFYQSQCNLFLSFVLLLKVYNVGTIYFGKFAKDLRNI